MNRNQSNMWTNIFEKKIDLEYFSSEKIDQVINVLRDTDNNKILSEEIARNFQNNPLFPYLKTNHNRRPIKSILSSIRKHYNGFGLIEKPYLDLEYWDSHTGYYAKSFSQYRLDCIRIHFFTGTEKNWKKLKSSLLSGVDEQKLYNELDFRWIGYCVLRPTPSYCVGRTGILFDETPAENLLMDEEKGGKPYLKTHQYCFSNLLNCHFSNEKVTEFIQQDPNLGHCATASLWVTSNVMAKKFGMHRLHYRIITQQALGMWDRETNIKKNFMPSIPENGLTPSEIKNAIYAIGADILEFSLEETESYDESYTRLSLEIYSFMESGFPVLLGLINETSRHVVAVVGHLLPKIDTIEKCINASPLFAKDKRNKLTDRHYLIASMINLYYVHDDNYGPYNRLIIENDKNNNLPNCNTLPIEQSNKLTISLGKQKIKYELDRVFVPVDPMIKVRSNQICLDLITSFDENYAKFYNENEIFLWRSILLKNSDFKQSLSTRYDNDKDLLGYYATLHLPKYIWLFELTIVEENGIHNYFYNPSYSARPIDGEFIYDATSPPADIRILSARLSGIYRDYTTDFTPISYDNIQGWHYCYESKSKGVKKDE